MTKPTGNPIGRPKAKKLPRGRPKGQEAIMKEMRMRLLRSPKSEKVLNSIVDVAMDPDHKHWPAASKMVMDRIMPLTGFNPTDKSGEKLEINITTYGATDIKSDVKHDGKADVDEPIEAVFTEVKPDA